MTRKIVQYCYFGENSNEREYEQIADSAMGTQATLGQISEEMFNQMLADGKLYIYDNELFINLAQGTTYEPERIYYKRKLNLIRENYPKTIGKDSLCSGTIFNGVTPIIKLGIQSIPGTKFRVNTNNDYIIIGNSGIYEIDLTQTSGVITHLSFDGLSLDNIDKNPNGYLIIDIMSEKEENT